VLVETSKARRALVDRRIYLPEQSWCDDIADGLGRRW
jgi:hypothetical protein